MGVVNVTPDSFSDGGKFYSCDKAVAHAIRLLDEGADILDIGGESTRPGAHAGAANAAVDAAEELARILPVFEAVKRERPTAVLSVDTYKSAVARAAISAGADIVNDVSGMTWDPAMSEILAGLQCGALLMHTRGRPDEWKALPEFADPFGEVHRGLDQLARDAARAGIARNCIVLDPGFGFGKRYEENYPLLARFGELHALGFPLAAGTSRKSFLGRIIAGEGMHAKEDAPPGERLHASVAAAVITILAGAHIVRVHDVKETVEAARVADAVLACQGG
ncbi:MAG: dihydropteroate synthase [Candidatus Koribacter versatilis]|uniref:dihydropteroate synthase n=1 Tax=Candidatus Korobacter versatilis TaxID=658062 RepID=A0A932A7U5_9BACT|nr:dihydropteroate synthase [Candidatus Koribacter versatilis]